MFSIDNIFLCAKITMVIINVYTIYTKKEVFLWVQQLQSF